MLTKVQGTCSEAVDALVRLNRTEACSDDCALVAAGLDSVAAPVAAYEALERVAMGLTMTAGDMELLAWTLRTPVTSARGV